jgi:hypothetical protein
MKAVLQKIFFVAGLLLFFTLPYDKAFADAPFITDDAGVMDPGSWDTILYATVDRYKAYSSLQAPALEFDFGFIPNSEIDIYVPYLIDTGAKPSYRVDLPNQSGVSDIDVEFKYNLLKETKYLPAVTLVPNIFLPTGNVNRALGNGRTYYTLPVTVAKKIGNWATYAELGYGLNAASFAVNYLFGGVVAEKDFTDKLTMGAEIYSQGKSSIYLSSYTLLNLGATYKLDKHASLLFSLGHGIIGQEKWTSYVGIEWA